MVVDTVICSVSKSASAELEGMGMWRGQAPRNNDLPNWLPFGIVRLENGL
jgi:hypothetical protein